MIILASQSPRRKEILNLIRIPYTCIPSHVEEIVPEGMSPSDIPQYLSGLKAADIAASHPDDIVIGSDTIVVIDVDGRDTVLGKPVDEADAARMLRLLSGRTHRVYTGVTIISPGGTQAFTSHTDVTFYELTDQDISDYISTGETLDKAGAYGIQGPGAVLIRSIVGDYFTVMGLPAAEVARRIKSL